MRSVLVGGGQQQRVAIARALALHPTVLTRDEVIPAVILHDRWYARGLVGGARENKDSYRRPGFGHEPTIRAAGMTSALDPELVGEVLGVIRGLASDGITMLVVSHEMGFVREVSSRVAFMAEGRIAELGPPAEVFAAARDLRARDFFARGAVIPA